MDDKEYSRIQLAACAMAALLRRTLRGGAEQGYHYDVHQFKDDRDALAADSLAVADAMLAQHEKTWTAK